MNVLIVPEDFRQDQYLLKPLFERLFEELGRPQKVMVCQNPRLRGVQQALDRERLRDIVTRYPMDDIFILCVDRDGMRNRKTRLIQIENEFTGLHTFIAENAWEEIETWALAGLKLRPGWTWRSVRSEVSVKETYFEPLARHMGLADGPGGGRKEMGMIAAQSIKAIRRKCPEDFGDLANRLQKLLAVA